MKRTLAALTAGALGVALVPAAAGAQDDATNTIVDVVIGASGPPGDFDSNSRDYDLLREALIAAGLVDTVATTDDITVFAPTDYAFIKLAEDLGFEGGDEQAAFGFIASKVIGENEDGSPDLSLLQEILAYHVAPDARSVFALRFAGDIPTLAGADKTVDVFFNRVRDLDPDNRDARLRRPRNLRADNGIIHTIDRVLRPSDLDAAPPPSASILDIVLDVSDADGLDDNGADYDILRDALIATGLDAAVSDTDADVTVFAPTDDAFIKLAQELDDSVVTEADAFAAIAGATIDGDDTSALQNILLYHVAPGGQTVRQLNFLRPVETLNGQNVRLFFNRVIDANFATADARIISPSDLQASNGVIQTVDRVLRPS